MSKIDILLTAFLIVFKFTIAPTISWWLVFAPMLMSFFYGFLRGYFDGSEDKHKE